MGIAFASDRDRDILRSYVRRIDQSDAGAHNNLGVLYHQRGLIEEAFAAFSRALELDPKMQVAQRNVEIACFSSGFYVCRVEELTERLRLDPADREARWELGRTYAVLGDAREAVEEFTTLLAHHPGDVGAIVQLGLAEKARGNLPAAQGWLEQALVRNPDDAVISRHLGEVLYNRGLNDQALAALDRSIAAEPDSPEAHHLIGFVYGDMGRPEDARRSTRRAIQLNPSLARAQANLSLDQYNPARYQELLPERHARSEQRASEQPDAARLAHFSLGIAFRAKAYFAEALREFRIAIDRGADEALVTRAMAEVHLLSGNPRGALELYDRALALGAPTAQLHCERGVAQHQGGQHEDAAASYRQALDLDPDHAVARNNLGVALHHAGDSRGALAAFEEVVARRPDFVKAMLNQALLLFRLRSPHASLEAYRRALAVAPDHPVAWNGIGLVLAEQKRFDDARNAFGSAIHARPSFAEAHYNLGFALANLGDYEGALRATRRALELDPYYVPQKFQLALQLEHEDSGLDIAPELGEPKRMESGVESFSFEPARLDELFDELVADAAAERPMEPSVARQVLLVDDLLAVAREYLAAGLLDRATAEISRAMGRGADPAEALTLLGDLFTRQGLHGEALERYRQALALRPDTPRAQAGEARALLLLGRPTDARPLAEALLSPGAGVDILLLVATVRRDSGDGVGARALLDQAREATPLRSDVHHQLGDLAFQLGDDPAAIAAYAAALAIDPDLAVVRHQMARALARSGAHADAERQLVAALEAVPTYVDATLELASVRRQMGRLSEALEPLVKLLTRNPCHIDALVTLAGTLLELERPEDASRALERVRHLDPDHPTARQLEE
ncbi:MAG: tetratricopeptide repeat protein, partial [Gemmatimonadota bacterium]|nr:tetratricopeptide repeat protein [Gemmatimonadota bacterium]